MGKYKHLITVGILKPLEGVDFHHKAPLDRYVMLQKDSVEGDGGFRVVTHIITDLPKDIPEYCDLHWHDFDEVNLITSEDNSLTYKIRLEDEEYIVTSPSTIYIPKGTRHSAEVISGKGVYMAITFTKDYKANK
jgi:hypothetical protein